MRLRWTLQTERLYMERANTACQGQGPPRVVKGRKIGGTFCYFRRPLCALVGVSATQMRILSVAMALAGAQTASAYTPAWAK